METTFPAGVAEAPTTVTKVKPSVKESSKPAEKDQEKRPSIARGPSATNTLKSEKAEIGASVSSSRNATSPFKLIPTLLRKLRPSRSRSNKGNRGKGKSARREEVTGRERSSDSSGVNTSFGGSDSSAVNTSFRGSKGMLGDPRRRSNRGRSSSTSSSSSSNRSSSICGSISELVIVPEVAQVTGHLRHEHDSSSDDECSNPIDFKFDLKFDLLSRFSNQPLYVEDKDGKHYDEFMFGFPNGPGAPLPIKIAETGKYLQITDKGDIVLGDSRNGHTFCVSYWSTNNNENLRFMKTKLEGRPYMYLGAHKHFDGKLSVYIRDEPPSRRFPPHTLCLRMGQV